MCIGHDWSVRSNPPGDKLDIILGEIEEITRGFNPYLPTIQTLVGLGLFEDSDRQQTLAVAIRLR